MNSNTLNYSFDEQCVSCIEYGNKQTADVTVVFIHGWLDNAASFSSVMRLLNQQLPSAHLCAIDLPGHGFSSHKSETSFYPFHDYIDDVYRLLSKLSPNRLVLVGHSLGALIASCYSAAFPEQVDALIQIEGNGPLAESADQTLSRLRKGIASRQRIRRKPVRRIRSLSEAIERRSKVNDIAPELIAPVVERGLQSLSDGYSWRHDPKLQSDSLYRMSEEQAAEIRQQILCPQVVILGDRGFKHLQQYSSQFVHKASQVITISGGHHCHLEDPVRVSDLIFGLVNKI